MKLRPILRELAFHWPFLLAAWLFCASGMPVWGQCNWEWNGYQWVQVCDDPQAQQQADAQGWSAPSRQPGGDYRIGEAPSHQSGPQQAAVPPRCDPIEQQQPWQEDRVVKIRNSIQEGYGWGSGCVLSVGGDNSYVLTAGHNVSGQSDWVAVVFNDGKSHDLAQVIAYDRQIDYALLKLYGGPREQAFAFSQSQPLDGSPCYAVGFPDAGGIAVRRGTVRDSRYDDRMEMEGSAIQGESGGPMVTDRQEVFAVITEADPDNNLTLCCHYQPLRRMLDSLFPNRWATIVPHADKPTPAPAPSPAPPYQPPIAEQQPAPYVPPIQPQEPEIEVEISEPLEPVQPATPPVAEAPPVPPQEPSRSVTDVVIDAAPAAKPALTYGPIVAGALGLSTPIGMGIVFAAMIGRRRVKRRIAERRTAEMAAAPTQRQPPDGQFVAIQRTNVVSTDTPPPPQQVITRTQFAPYETDSFARADSEAMTQYVRKYPGAATTLESFKGMRQQYQQAMR